MADTTVANALVNEFIDSLTVDGLWSSEDTLHALEMARSAPVPSRVEEEWRKTDPETFPWAEVEAVDPQRTRRELIVRPLGKGENTGLSPLASAADREAAPRRQQVVVGLLDVENHGLALRRLVGL